MKRAVAFAVYYLGAAWIAYLAVRFANTLSYWEFLFATIYLIALWWIAAGIGIRLGVYPSEAFAWFGRLAGILDPPRRRSGSKAANTPDLTN